VSVTRGTIYTIGHSTRPWDIFVDVLREYAIQAVVDIRRYPGSKRFPHFNRGEMECSLPRLGIEYHWFEALGGRRTISSKGPTSPNQGLRTLGFRAYADYMGTEDFRSAVTQLLALCTQRTCALLCAERLYWKCHRRLASDYLTSLGIDVFHVEEQRICRKHMITPGAVLQDEGGVLYPFSHEPQQGNLL
jgi:uncharacterized protein (DUF488 family)